MSIVHNESWLIDWLLHFESHNFLLCLCFLPSSWQLSRGITITMTMIIITMCFTITFSILSLPWAVSSQVLGSVWYKPLYHHNLRKQTNPCIWMTFSVKLDRNLNKLTIDIPSSSPVSPLPMTWPQSCAQEYAGHHSIFPQAMWSIPLIDTLAQSSNNP